VYLLVESKYVLNGLIAGFIAGVITAIVVYITLPSTGEVLKAIEDVLGENSSYIDVVKPWIDPILLLSGPIIVVVMLFIGTILGALHEYIDKKVQDKPLILSCVIVGSIMYIVFVAPNILLGSIGKAYTNTITVITYTISLTILNYKWSPR